MLWLRLRRIVQFIMLAAFAALTLGAAQFSSGWFLSGLFSRLDPLMALALMVSSRTFIALWLLAFVTIAATVVFGRVWCGWICPLGTVIEYAPTRKLLKRKLPSSLRFGKYVTLAVVMGTALVGGLGPMILDPITILTRPLQELGKAWVGSDAVGQSVGASIGRVGIHSVVWLSLAPLALVLALNLIDRRFWCANLCPLGGLLALLSSVPGVRRIVNTETCTSCARCAKACPTSAVRQRDSMSTDAGECIVCMRCIAECPEDANRFALTRPKLIAAGYDPGRRATLVAIGATGTALAGACAPIVLADPTHGATLRPPATDEARLAALCVRCGACYSACPTGSLRPSVSFITEAGPWTPMLDERPGHCTERCNKCAAPCPTDAIHTFTPEERALRNLDVRAEVDRDRCRAWSRNRECMACAAACPISGALDRMERPANLPVPGPNPNKRPVNVPVIDLTKCIGCNLCASACVLDPTAIGAPLPYDPDAVRNSGKQTIRLPNGELFEMP